jgi:hypothetical protein
MQRGWEVRATGTPASKGKDRSTAVQTLREVDRNAFERDKKSVRNDCPGWLLREQKCTDLRKGVMGGKCNSGVRLGVVNLLRL